MIASLLSTSVDDTRRIGAELARRLSPDGTALVSGDLGSGKTVLAQGFARGLGIPPSEVQSPTYSLVREHRGDLGAFFHLDLYRLEEDDLYGLGLEEILAGPGVKLVEWAERLPFDVPGALWVWILRGEGGQREIRIDE